MTEQGTLEQIGAMDGDKVLCISNIIDFEDGERYDTFTSGKCYTFASRGMIGDNDDEWPGVHPYCGIWRIISRATSTPTLDLTAITTPFGLLDEATQDALRAHGGPYVRYDDHGEWVSSDYPFWYQGDVYRVAPSPSVEKITCDAYIHPSGIISKIESDTPQPVRVTFNRINGVIDLASYKVDPR